MRDLLIDWALRRARRAALTANLHGVAAEYGRRRPIPPYAGRALARSEWWHDVAAWLDGIGAWPGRGVTP